jgi:hypothetical protein
VAVTREAHRAATYSAIQPYSRSSGKRRVVQRKVKSQNSNTATPKFFVAVGSQNVAHDKQIALIATPNVGTLCSLEAKDNAESLVCKRASAPATVGFAFTF